MSEKKKQPGLPPDIRNYPKTPVLGYRDDGTPVIDETFLDECDDRLAGSGYCVGDTDGWYPTIQQAEELVSDIVENYEFIYWLCNSNPELAGKYRDVYNVLHKALYKVEFESKEEWLQENEKKNEED